MDIIIYPDPSLLAIYRIQQRMASEKDPAYRMPLSIGCLRLLAAGSVLLWSIGVESHPPRKPPFWHLLVHFA
jgi:hypothetical protein